MKLLVAIELSDFSDIIVENAIKFAKKLHAEIFLLHVVDPEPEFLGAEYGTESNQKHMSNKIERERSRLQKFADRYINDNIKITTVSCQGPIAQKIIEESNNLGCEMLVMGSHGRNALYQMVLGSISEAVLCNSELPVIIIPNRKK